MTDSATRATNAATARNYDTVAYDAPPFVVLDVQRRLERAKADLAKRREYVIVYPVVG
jgi:hypothetical protein